MKFNMELTMEPGTNVVTFLVDRSCEWLTLKFAYDQERTWVCLNLCDPSGKLRYTHLDFYYEREVTIHNDPKHTSDMGVAGKIDPGEWKISFALKHPRVFTFQWETGDGNPLDDMKALHVPPRRYWCDSNGARAGGYALNRYDWHEQKESGRRWYKGDFHTHSRLSDGKMTPEQNNQQAEMMGLDFFAVTDHNLLPTSWPDGKPLIIPGMELTSLQSGHWNAIGLRKWLDWTDGLTDNKGVFTQDMQNRLMEEAGRLGALRSINHPLMAQFSWLYQETPLAYMDALEICNSPNCSGAQGFTENALFLWGILWNEGYQVPGMGGSDSHLLPTERYGDTGLPSYLGDPATYVDADNLSAEAIIAAARTGRMYVSRGPVLDIRVSVEEREYPLGSDLTEHVNASQEGKVLCRLLVSGAAGCELQFIENGKRIATYAISEAEQAFEFSFTWKNEDYVWSRIDIRSGSGELLVFTNPVFYGEKKPQITTWGQLLARTSSAKGN